jgi:hypothetical protein
MNVHRAVPGCRWLTALCLVVPAGRAAAQRSPATSVLVSATVVSDRLSMATLRPVEFTAGRHAAATTIQPTESAAGEWRVVGTPNAMIRMNLTLPSALVNSRDSTRAPLAIAFAPTSGRWGPDVEDAAAAAAFDPHHAVSGRFGAGRDPTLYVWLGGSVQPSTTTAAGTYRGSVTLTLVYY